MDAAYYQNLVALAGMANAGYDVSSQSAQLLAAAEPQKAYWTKVEQIVSDYSRSNEERLETYYNEVLPLQSQDLIQSVIATAPTVAEFVKQSLAEPSASPQTNEAASLIGTGFGVDPTGGQAVNLEDVPVYTAGAGADLLGLIGLIGGLYSGFSQVKELYSGTPAANLYGEASTLEGGNLMASGTDIVTVNGGTSVGGVSFGGPGVPEPPASMVAKAWKTKAFSKTAGEYWVYFWKLTDGRILSYNAAKKSAKIWRPKKPIVMYRGSITLSQAVRTQRMLDKLWKTVAKKTKALKLA